MVKITRKDSDIVCAAKSDLAENKKGDRGYNTQNVNRALQETFHGKCYLCENKKVTSFQIEHLIPHKQNLDLKYAWSNMFWSCEHCNNTKLAKYDPILDCTMENVDEMLAFRKSGHFGTQEKIEIDIIKDSLEARNTRDLLMELYYGHTPQKQIEARIIRKELREDIAKFKEYIRSYNELDSWEEYEKRDLECLIKRELSESAPFAAFKRWLIRDFYPEYNVFIPS